MMNSNDEQTVWQLFDHGADIGVRGYGDTAAMAFARAATAMTAVITDPRQVEPGQAISIHCHAPELELLFVEWLNALIYEMSTRKMLFSRFEVSIDNKDLEATAWGEAVDIERHSPAVEIKGATYTALTVRQDKAGIWLAQCVVDV
jgi:SHS2 domain-containing protein